MDEEGLEEFYRRSREADERRRLMSKAVDNFRCQLHSSMLSEGSDGSRSPGSRASLLRDDGRRGRRCTPILLTILVLCLLACIAALLLALQGGEKGGSECGGGAGGRGEGNPWLMEVREDVDGLDSTSSRLLASFRPERIGADLRWLSEGMHVAGTREQLAIMARLAREYEQLGFRVSVHNYTVLLNYPDWSRGNTVEVYKGRGEGDETTEWETLSAGLGRVAEGDEEMERQQSDPRARLWWNAYSGNGTAVGHVVYANYGFDEDWGVLERSNIPLRGAIVLMRYGGIPRADKVREAERRGAKAVLLFSDPIHYTGFDRNATFPSTLWLPGSGAQRGSLLSTVGDPETPAMPSMQYVNRQEDARSLLDKGQLPRIPVTPIGYDDAHAIMHSMDGPAVKDAGWRGGLSSVYRLYGTGIYRVSVRSRSVHRTISNVIAVWPGREHPDEWVLVGNHVDAWVNGAIDPNSGTATQLEMARVVSEVMSGPSRPRRSLVFCHWDAEEFGLIGSTEWVEEMLAPLQQRAVAMLNVDHIAGNASVDVKAVPMLYRVLTEAAARIPTPSPTELRSGRLTLLDSWRHYRGKSGPLRGDRSIPEMGVPGVGSDYQRFISYAGISSADLKMESAPSAYALYHTMYEIPWAVEQLLDPHMHSMTAMGQLWAETAHRMANQLILPLNVLDLASALSSQWHRVDSQMAHWNVTRAVRGYSLKTDSVRDSIARLHRVAKRVDVEVHDVSSGHSPSTPSRVSQLNSRLRSVERALLSPLPADPLHRHVVYRPTTHPSAVGGAFAIVLDPAYAYTLAVSEEERRRALDEIDTAISHVQYAIESVIHVLEEY